MSYLQAILKTEFSFIANTSGKITTFISILCIVSFLAPKTGNETGMTEFLLVM